MSTAPQLTLVYPPEPRKRARARRSYGLPYAQTDTSFDAAESMRARVPTLEAKVLAFIEARGAEGATCDEVLIGCELTHQCGSARVSELARRGAIVDSGQRRLTRGGRKAIVYVTADAHERLR